MRCRTNEYSFDSAYPLFRYDGDARTLILAYKSKKRRSLALFFALLIARGIEEKYPGRVVVPVPPRSGKKRRKGWDQVEDIVRILETRHGFIVARVLGRSDGIEQKSLNLKERKLNMAGTIYMRKGRIAPDQPILLDDILTTGATLSECAAILKAGGASRVDACMIAAD
jgi:ComF family protein